MYQIEANIKVSELQNPRKFKLLKCTGNIQDYGNKGTVVLENSPSCQEVNDVPNVESTTEDSSSNDMESVNDENLQVTEPIFVQYPVKLDNEVQPDNTVSIYINIIFVIN